MMTYFLVLGGLSLKTQENMSHVCREQLKWHSAQIIAKLRSRQMIYVR